MKKSTQYAMVVGTMLAISSNASAIVVQLDTSVDSRKLNVFNGSSPDIESYFVSESGSDALKANGNNSTLYYQPSWRYSGLPMPVNARIGGYTSIGNGECVTFVKALTNNLTTST